MLRLYVVRHGVTVWNQEARLQGHTDVPLNDTGRRQALLIADRLAGERIGAVWCSDMSRAIETASAIAAPHRCEVRPDATFRETGLGEWEGMTQEEIRARYGEDRFESYRSDPTTNPPPGGERIESVYDRIRIGIEAIARSGVAEAALVGHGGSLRLAICYALQAPPECARRMWLDNVSLTILEFGGQRPRVCLVNDTSHLRVAPA